MKKGDQLLTLEISNQSRSTQVRCVS